jgi:prepilin-type N-terminal cleavage/methylation domain-containing protein
MNTSVRARRDARGFSFVELLVTVVIAGIAFAAMVPLFVHAQQVSAGDKARSVALNLAQDRVEKIRQLDFELITRPNLLNNSFYFGEFGSSWTEQTEGGERDYNVEYAVVDKPVSATDARIAYKVVTVTVDWEGPPEPHRTAVLTTMIFRQYSGPEMVDFSILGTDLGLSDPSDLGSEPMVVASLVHLQATVNAADLNSMAPKVIGVAPNQRTLVGRVDFLVTSSAGAASPTISVPYSAASATPAVFPATWNVLPVGATAGAADGYYVFKAVALSAMGSPGNSWELTYRVETGPPAAVTNLAGTASLTTASLTWNASTTGDVDHYLVKRDGVTVTTLPKASGSMGYVDSGLTGPAGTTYVYTVFAVDWKGNESAPAQLTLVTIDPASLAPQPAKDLQGQAMNNVARLTWTASTTPGVLGYVVYQTIAGNTVTFTTASATLDVTQGWNTTALYQVKPYVAGNILSLSWATLLLGQPSQDVGGTPWLSVAIGAEPRYTLVVKNTTNKTLTSLKLYYLGAAGTDPQQEMLPAKSNIAVNATGQWTNLAAGKYRWDWVTSNNKTGSQTGWCSGANLTIQVSTP